jgi:hypothetical protein
VPDLIPVSTGLRSFDSHSDYGGKSVTFLTYLNSRAFFIEKSALCPEMAWSVFSYNFAKTFS